MSTVAVVVPCLNEASTIEKVVADFRRAVPEARIVVVDNDSTDSSAAIARAAGAVVVREPRRGKGFVMQAILQHAPADVVVIVDGDDTYPASEVRNLLAPMLDGRADMVVGTRLASSTGGAMRPINRLGNAVISHALNVVWGTDFSDVLSGYRALSRRALNAIALRHGGFETEVELTIRAVAQGLAICEVPVSYHARPRGSVSKLRPFRDGWRILATLGAMLSEDRARLTSPRPSVPRQDRHIDARVVETGAAAEVRQRVGHERVPGLAVEGASEPQALGQ